MKEKQQTVASIYPVLDPILELSSSLHRHLCPRQVLGARLAIYALAQLELHPITDPIPYENPRKRLLTIAETDGCAVDGISAATNCWVGRRTLRVVDFGKVGATFVDTKTGTAIRVSPRADIREKAKALFPNAKSRWHAYLDAYFVLPDEELLQAEAVELTESVQKILSRPKARAICDVCQEEILNEREVLLDGQTLCRACAGSKYYRAIS